MVMVEVLSMVFVFMLLLLSSPFLLTKMTISHHIQKLRYLACYQEVTSTFPERFSGNTNFKISVFIHSIVIRP